MRPTLVVHSRFPGLAPSRLALVLAAVACSSLAGCKAETDLGQGCKMTRPSADGKTEEIDEAKLLNAGIDYVALGAAECDDLVCIRSAKTDRNPPNEDGKGRGYCTRPCYEDSDCNPDFKGNDGTLKCERLLLDEAFLDALKKSDPKAYEEAFGTDTAARYCVHPRQAS